MVAQYAIRMCNPGCCIDPQHARETRANGLDRRLTVWAWQAPPPELARDRSNFDLFAERTARPLPPAGEEGKVRSYYSRAYSLRRSYMECGIDLDHRHGGMPWRVTGDCAVACDVRVLEELSLGPWLVALPRTSVLD